MSRYTIDPAAKEDLKAVHRHIAKDSPTAAKRVRQAFSRTFRLLASQPLLGEAREDLSSNLRMFCVGNYVILYYPTKHGIAVVQVVHGARNWPNLWEKGHRRE